MVSRPAVFALPRTLLEMQSNKIKISGNGAQKSVLTSPPGDYDLRTIGLVHQSREQSRLLGQKQSRHKEYTFLWSILSCLCLRNLSIENGHKMINFNNRHVYITV